MQGRKIWYQKSLVSAFTRAISNRRGKSSIYKVLRERKCEPRMSFSAKLLCKYKDNRHNSLISQVPKIESKHQNSPVQKMEGKAVMKVKALVAQSFPTLRPHGLQPARLLCPWNFPGMNTGVGCHALLQEIFPTQGSKPGLLHCRQIFYCLSHQALAQYSMARSTHFEGQKYIQFSSVQSLSHVRLFETPWTAARQASLSITYSWSLLKIMSIELLMPSTISFSVVITRILKKKFFKYNTRILKKKSPSI